MDVLTVLNIMTQIIVILMYPCTQQNILMVHQAQYKNVSNDKTEIHINDTTKLCI